MKRTQFTRQTLTTKPIPYHPEDIFVFSIKGDRFDILSQRYYGTPDFWWVLRLVNAESFGLFPNPGKQLRIPSNRDNRLVTFFETLNA